MSDAKRILAVDDEPLNLRVLEGFLGSIGHQYVSVESGQQALDTLDSSFDLVLLDIMMPGMDGFETAHRIRQSPDFGEVPIIMVTALSAKKDRLKAVEAGANDFIAKPIDKVELRVRMESLLRMKEARDALHSYQSELEEMVRIRTEALQLAVENLTSLQDSTKLAYLETIHRLAIAAEYKDTETAQHIQRMGLCSGLLAEKVGLHKDEVAIVLHASPMHDVGKIGIPDSILLKPAKLDPDEWTKMKDHTSIGARILDSSDSELLQAGSIIALSHHEKWDGSGYPNGLVGEDIPLFGRICAITDVFDALNSKRPYKEAFSLEKTLEIMKAGRGTHFDPTLFDLFMENLDEIIRISKELED
jgi:putative two-component system response regulator